MLFIHMHLTEIGYGEIMTLTRPPSDFHELKNVCTKARNLSIKEKLIIQPLHEQTS